MSRRRRRVVAVVTAAVTVVAAGAAFAAVQFATPATPVRDGPVADATTSSTAGNATTTTSTVRQLSPAWVEAELFMDVDTVFDNAGLRRFMDRDRVNPNQWTTPMGALCWGYFELSRAAGMTFFRAFLDEE